jgi:hypothetical protein
VGREREEPDRAQEALSARGPLPRAPPCDGDGVFVPLEQQSALLVVM